MISQNAGATNFCLFLNKQQGSQTYEKCKFFLLASHLYMNKKVTKTPLVFLTDLKGWAKVPLCAIRNRNYTHMYIF